MVTALYRNVSSIAIKQFGHHQSVHLLAHDCPIRALISGLILMGDAAMDFTEALRMAERNLTEGANLTELKELAQDLQALIANSILADLIEIKIAVIEGHWDEA
ncbi:hypothetical protein KBI52_11390 [Microvirga sp. HBU67558]|uniref:hypothetical protein n=1 Tax=Microvirga TaxID=186650 RepID=UPI001B3701D9|nr:MULTISPECIES: hypothetical protein [unclassified Microvirga]MBQ0820809.1 hypothetical protein [Microvirga sp. HBU67558]